MCGWMGRRSANHEPLQRHHFLRCRLSREVAPGEIADTMLWAETTAERLVPPAVAGDLPAHLQGAAEQRLHLPPCLAAPGGRRDGADQEQHADPREEIRKSGSSGSCWGETIGCSALSHCRTCRRMSIP